MPVKLEVKTCTTFKPFQIDYRDEVDLSVINEILKENEYKECLNIIKNAKHAILDIGAHIGIFNLYVRNLNPTVPLYNFEPHPENFRLLKQNIKQNRLKNIICKNQAVSNIKGDTKMHLSKNNHNHSLISPLEPDGTSINTSSTTIPDIINKFDLAQIDLLKMDCEGSEFEIIKNLGPETFSKINSIFFEYHETQTRKIESLISILISQGFQTKKFISTYVGDMGFVMAKK